MRKASAHWAMACSVARFYYSAGRKLALCFIGVSERVDNINSESLYERYGPSVQVA